MTAFRDLRRNDEMQRFEAGEGLDVGKNIGWYLAAKVVVLQVGDDEI